MQRGNVWIKPFLVLTIVIAMNLANTFPVLAAGKMTNKQALDKARKTFNNISSFQADLIELFQWKLVETTTENRGKMMYRNDDRFYLEFTNQKLIVDGKDLWRYSPVHHQVIVEPYSDETGVILPKQLMSGLSKDWVLENDSEVFLEDSIGIRLNLQPNNPQSTFRQIAVWIDPGNWLVCQAIVDDAQGNRTVYRIENIAVNPVLPDSLFQMDIPERTETIDLR